MRKQFEFKLNDKILEVVDHIKYLGCMLNNKLCDEFDIDKCNSALSVIIASIDHLFFCLGNLYQLTVKCF